MAIHTCVDIFNDMGTAILTNLNGMTNPPSDLNEIATGWKFVMWSIPAFSVNLKVTNKGDAHAVSGTFTKTSSEIPTGTETTVKTYLGLTAYSAQICTWPTKIVGLASMQNMPNVSQRSQTKLEWKPWPANPTVDAILDTTTYPLKVLYGLKNSVQYLALRLATASHDSDGDLEYAGCINITWDITETGMVLKCGVMGNVKTYVSSSHIYSLSYPASTFYGWYLPA